MRYLLNLLLIVLVGVIGLSVVVEVHADGKVFARPNYAKLPVPDQQAVIIYNDKTNTQSLIIQTHFTPEVAKGVQLVGNLDEATQDPNEFAWVVPLPSKPEVTQVDPSIFRTLRVRTRPYVYPSSDEYLGLIALACFGLIFSLIVVRVRFDGTEYGKVLRRIQYVTISLILIGFVVLSLLPALGAARASIGSPQNIGIEVTSRQSVGPYEITTISSENPNALVDYLNAQGFRIPDEANPVIENYVKNQWQFACIKLNPEVLKSEGTVSPTPLNFTFNTEKPVYPLALTAVENETCVIDLYVIANQQMTIPAFETKRAAQLSYHEITGYRAYGTRSGNPNESYIPIYYEQYKDVIDRVLPDDSKSEIVLTKLSRRFEPGEMKDDAYLQATDFNAYMPSFHTNKTAKKQALYVTMLSVVILMIIVACVIKSPVPRFKFVPVLLLLVIPAAVYLTMFYSAARIESVESIHPLEFRRTTNLYCDYAIKAYHSHVKKSKVKPTVEGARKFVADYFANPSDEELVEYLKVTPKIIAIMNPSYDMDSQSMPCKHEPTPGNYVIVERDNGDIEMVLFNIVGEPEYPNALWKASKN
ncbi:DUF2330 domain-containing protein [Planctomycetota bacterium]|nr:DUF2330 domain-containing protein [Planctomycetota bacterium]